MTWRDVPLPDRMKGLARDKRGFPVPFIVAHDNAGEPVFTVNDTEIVKRATRDMLCGICGGELEHGDLWWVGGPLSAFHPNGAFVDGPMHCECSTYALQVCPHLAAPRYTKRLDAAPGDKNGVPFAVMLDHTVLPDRPLVFVQGQSISYDVDWPLTPLSHLHPRSGYTLNEEGEPVNKRWLHYEVWQHGTLIEDEKQGIDLIRQSFAEANKQRVQSPKLYVPETPGIQV